MSWPRISKKIAKQFELITGAIHEASHTIYALLHYMKVESVCVFEDKKLKRIHGATYYDFPVDIELVEDQSIINCLVRSDVGMSYSGLIAEKILFKSLSGLSQTPMFIRDGSTDDNKDAREMIAKYNLAAAGQKRSAYKRKLMREVQLELTAYWNDIVLISHNLIKRRKLNYTDLQMLLTKKSINKVFWKEHFKGLNNIFNSETLDENVLRIKLLG